LAGRPGSQPHAHATCPRTPPPPPPGDPVVTKLRVAFSLPAALAPHARLPPWQQRLAKRAGGGALHVLSGAGWAAGVAEDAWLAAAAAWRAGGAVGAPALGGATGPAWGALNAAGGAAWRVAKARLLPALGWAPAGGGAQPPGPQGWRQRGLALVGAAAG
jgi:hypothetical protein